MERGKLIVVSGPSGVGKGTILRSFYQSGEFPLVPSVSATTRSPRPGERDGVDYHFLKDEDFQNRRANGEFIECFQVFQGGHWYGTLKKTVEDALDRGDWLVLEIDLKGMREVLKSYPDALTIFIVPPDVETLKDRLRKRGTEDAAAVSSRLDRALEELAESDFCKYKIVNDELEKAKEDFRRILSGSSGK
ncbi:MAG: guanylate kinase [Planctomycetia bacterium]|nr:guanylate kinase [Planctomycetia bacterium]